MRYIWGPVRDFHCRDVKVRSPSNPGGKSAPRFASIASGRLWDERLEAASAVEAEAEADRCRQEVERLTAELRKAERQLREGDEQVSVEVQEALGRQQTEHNARIECFEAEIAQLHKR